MKRTTSALVLAMLSLVSGPSGSAVAASFVNFETPTVHPLDLSPDRNTLAVANLPAGRLLLFDVADGNPREIGSVAVGIDPVSVRFRGNDEVWVVNQVSDSVSVVDVPTLRVRATLDTDDEPADVVFAGKPLRAFVSCSQADTVLVFKPGKLTKRPKRVRIGAEEPRAMAVSPDGKTVYVAIFESGNRSTVLPGGFEVAEKDSRPTIPRNVVSDPGAADLVVTTVVERKERSWLYDPTSQAFEPDRAAAPALNLDALLAEAAPGAELTFTMVPPGTGRRIAFAGSSVRQAIR